MAERGPDQTFPLPSLDRGRQRPLLGSGQKEYTRENITFLGTGSLSNFVAGQRCK